jgi:nitroreductase
MLKDISFSLIINFLLELIFLLAWTSVSYLSNNRATQISILLFTLRLLSNTIILKIIHYPLTAGEINMGVFDTIKDRRSIRTYKDERIPKDKLEKLLEAARLAPSAGNRQNWKFIVVENEQIKNQLVTASNNQAFVGTASHVIAGIGDSAQKWHQVDLSIALEHIVLEAVELGLGTCWIGAFNEEEVKKILKIPQDKKVVALLTVGVPAESPAAKPRKSLKEIVAYNEYT